MLISSRLPIGVATMYKPDFIIILLILFIFLNSCSPVNNSSLENVELVEEIDNKKIIVMENKNIEEKNNKIKPELYIGTPLLEEVSIILPINN